MKEIQFGGFRQCLLNNSKKLSGFEYDFIFAVEGFRSTANNLIDNFRRKGVVASSGEAMIRVPIQNYQLLRNWNKGFPLWIIGKQIR